MHGIIGLDYSCGVDLGLLFGTWREAWPIKQQGSGIDQKRWFVVLFDGFFEDMSIFGQTAQLSAFSAARFNFTNNSVRIEEEIILIRDGNSRSDP